MVSIIIPSRNDEFLFKTVEDLLAKARGEVEIIIILDGYWPETIVDYGQKVTILHQGTIHNSRGMRQAINDGISLSKGEYVMKIDEHCMVDEGYDLKLVVDCADNMVVIPRRYRLDAENWEIIEDGRPPVDYMCIDYPYQRPHDKTCGLHGAEWKRPERADILIDDTPSFQGSCYFMSRKHWDNCIGFLDDREYGQFTQEAQEIGMKTWLSGGSVTVNKKTWYAHMHKGKKGKGYGFSNAQYQMHQEGTERGRVYCIDLWLHTKDYLHDWGWFIDEKFPTMPGWGNDWRERIEVDKEFDYSKLRINEKQN